MHYIMKTKWLVSDIPEDITSKSYRSLGELRQLAQALLHKKKNPEWIQGDTDIWAETAYTGEDFQIRVPPS